MDGVEMRLLVVILTGRGESVAWNLPARRLASTGLSAAAATLTSTWSSPTAGTAAPPSSRSTLASPYASYTHAFICAGTSAVVAAAAAGDEDDATRRAALDDAGSRAESLVAAAW